MPKQMFKQQMFKQQMFKQQLVKQILGFGIVGVVAFLIDYGIMNILYTKLGCTLLIANTCGFVVSTIVNYILSKKHVFDMKTSNAFIKFTILSVIGLLINNITMILCIDCMMFGTLVSKVLATGVCMIWNFVTKKALLEKAGAKGCEKIR